MEIVWDERKCNTFVRKRTHFTRQSKGFERSFLGQNLQKINKNDENNMRWWKNKHYQCFCSAHKTFALSLPANKTTDGNNISRLLWVLQVNAKTLFRESENELMTWTKINECFSMSVCVCVHQFVHVGSAWDHSEVVHRSVGGLHLLLRPAIQADGLYDRWESLFITPHMYINTPYTLITLQHKQTMPFWMALTCLLCNSIFKGPL